MKFLVAGSAHLDILARPHTESSHKDRIGEVSIEVGGTACNVAFCLLKIGADVRLLTAWSDASTSKLMAGHIVASGVDLIADEIPGMPLAAFVAQLTADGDLNSAVSAMPVENHHFDRNRIEQAMDGVDCVIIEANLRANTMREMAVAANRAGIPIYALAVSEDKADRILPCARLLAGAFMNQAECDRLMRSLAVSTPTEVASALDAPLFVTYGVRGSSVFMPQGEVVPIPPPDLQEIANVLGVGDAFCAGMISGMVENGSSYLSAAEFAHGLVSEIAKQGSCNPYSMNALNNMVGDLWEKARMDKLTGLFRRGAFEMEFDRMSKGLNTVILIDCDNFKRVNDQIGHAAGDDVLRNVARVISEGIRSVDVACRWGGDEFAILLPRTDSTDARIVAERLRSRVLNSNLHGVTLSLGITAVTPGESLATAVARADQAMYSAKLQGKNAACYS